MGKTGSVSETETEAGGHEQSSGTGTTTMGKTGSMSETETEAGSTSETETKAGGHERSSGTGTTTMGKTGSTSETEAGGHKQSRVPGGGQHQRFEQQPSWASPQAWPVSAQAANPGSRLRP